MRAQSGGPVAPGAMCATVTPGMPPSLCMRGHAGWWWWCRPLQAYCDPSNMEKDGGTTTAPIVVWAAPRQGGACVIRVPTCNAGHAGCQAARRSLCSPVREIHVSTPGRR